LLRIIRSRIITPEALLIRGTQMRHLRALSVLLLAISFLARAQNTEIREGIIQGVVLDDFGNPLSGAKVHAELKGVPMAEKIRYVETDENGFFLIDQLEFGTYYVDAKNEEEGYGDSGASFFNDQPDLTAQISAQHRIADVVINLGPKAGRLTGTISDAATGKPIPAGFWLVQAKDRNKWMGTILLPNNGTWNVVTDGTTYSQKQSWYREGFDGRRTPLGPPCLYCEPVLKVTGERLGTPAPPLVAKANTVSASPPYIMVGFDIPAAGCWKITGRYEDTELSFVVSVR
jgi:hypothetical protein